MNVHEYQAKALLRERGVGALLPGRVAYTAEEAEAAARELPPGGPGGYAVKAQIHAGGRGRAGGIRLAGSPSEVGRIAGAMLGMTLVTPETGEAGRQVRRVYVEQGCDVARELYLSLLVDRATSRVTVIASAEGGVEIGAVAARTPEKILTLAIDPATGYQPFHGRRVAFALGLGGGQVRAAVDLLAGLYRAFVGLDASLLEVNPLAVARDGALVPLDVRLVLDDNALFRHPGVAQLQDLDEEDPHEIEAGRHELNYVRLDGNIGCMVNGAGLAMATMDLIRLSGGEPANFLDVGGGATKDRVMVAFRLLLSDPQVEGVLVNIFGGIMRCDLIAEGIVAAAREINVNLPLVVRLEGTNVEMGRQILADSGLAITPADDLGDAARRIVAAVREAG